MKLWGSKYKHLNLNLINDLTFNRRQILLKRWVWNQKAMGQNWDLNASFSSFFYLLPFLMIFQCYHKVLDQNLQLLLINTQMIFESVQNFLHLLYLFFSRDIFFFQAMDVLTSLWRPYGRIICLRTNLILWWRSQSVHRV